MEQHRVMGVLSAILAAACLILAVLLARVTRAREFLPESETADLVAVLAQSGIEVDPALVSTRRQSAAVYVCNSGDYAATVAELLTGSVPARTYVVPDEESLVTESGERMEFFGDFSFRYSADGTAPGEVVRDEEGMQTMRQLGLNMAFMIKSIRLGLQQFGSPKIQEELTETHYIR